ncbi:uncharacterized protein ACNS7B_000235 [Menidia menidia]
MSADYLERFGCGIKMYSGEELSLYNMDDRPPSSSIFSRLSPPPEHLRPLSVYSRLIARGQKVVFPPPTPLPNPFVNFKIHIVNESARKRKRTESEEKEETVLGEKKEKEETVLGEKKEKEEIILGEKEEKKETILGEKEEKKETSPGGERGNFPGDFPPF